MKSPKLKPPYWAVIFTSERTDENEGYFEMAEKMEKLAKKQEGYLAFESAREKTGISVSYWKDLESIQKWKQNMEHVEAQQKGRSKWYKNYTVRIAKIERDYFFEKPE